ncbi:MAG: STAS domain-containing protein [Solirubrobacteraceae bacterium]
MTDLAPRAGESGTPFQIQRDSSEQGAVLIKLRGELDLSTVSELERLLVECERDAASDVVIDLEEVEFMDSTGLAVIIAAGQAAQANGYQLRLRQGSPQVQRLFKLTGVLDRFTFVD